MTRQKETMDQLLARIKTLSELPLNRAHTMPPDIYHSNEWYERELKNIFYQDWSCAGLSADIPEPGDYLTWRIGDQPVFVMRQRDGSLKALANVCRHRMMPLLEGHGRCVSNRITCPYHAWSYQLDGTLSGAPQMEHRPDFDKAMHRLPSITLEVWEGWIYLTLNPSATPVSRLLKQLQPKVDAYGMADYVPVIQKDHHWNTNWKLLTENFMEGYHLPVAHKATVGAHFPADKTQFPERSDPAFTYQYFIKSDGAPMGTAHADNKRLIGEQRNMSLMPTIFPSHMYVLAPDHLWYLSLQPEETDHVHIRFGLALAPEVLAASSDREALVSEAVAFLDRVNEEDRVVVEGIFKGSKAPLTTPGPLSWLERENHEFTQYLARRMQDQQFV